jgi:hypothetical protein
MVAEMAAGSHLIAKQTDVIRHSGEFQIIYQAFVQAANVLLA